MAASAPKFTHVVSLLVTSHQHWHKDINELATEWKEEKQSYLSKKKTHKAL